MVVEKEASLHFVGKGISERYAKCRTKLPVPLIENLLSQHVGPQPGLWLDVGCGPGTSTQELIGRSEKIIGVDISETQLEEARKAVVHPSVTFLQGGGEALPVESASADIITVVQAVHWFDLPAFFKEAERVLKPGGVLGLVCYPHYEVPSSPTMNVAMKHVFFEFLGPYFFRPTMKHLEERYANIIIPFGANTRTSLQLSCKQTYDELVYSVSAWSGFQNYCEKHELTDEEGIQMVENAMGKFIEDTDREEEHVISETAIMVSAVKNYT